MVMQKGDTVWISRYALATVIYAADVEHVYDTGAVRAGGGYYGPGEWHSSLDEAQARVKEMATAALDDLEKQASKLKAIVDSGAKVSE